MSLRGTASGRLFAAYLPRELVLAALAAERADGPHAAGRAGAAGAAIDAAFRRQLEQVRYTGPLAAALRRSAEELSRQLGAPAAA